jgi:hypothetical protein
MPILERHALARHHHRLAGLCLEHHHRRPIWHPQKPPKLYFNPQGSFPYSGVGNRKFTVAANQVPGDTLAPGYPLSVDVMVPPPGASTSFQIQSAFCVSSVVRFGHPNTANYSALSSALEPDPYVFGSIATEGTAAGACAGGIQGRASVYIIRLRRRRSRGDSILICG